MDAVATSGRSVYRAHGDGADLHMAELAPQLLQQGRVRLVRQIAQGHVGVGPSPYLQPLQGQLGIPDAAAQQGGVFHDALHKAVVAAPQHLAGVRLLDAPQGELLGVHQHAAGVAVDDQQGLAGEYRRHGLVHVRLRLRLGHGDVLRHEGLQRTDAVQVPDGQPSGDGPLQHRVVGIAVHHPQPGPAAPDGQAAAHHIEAAAHAQPRIQLLRPAEEGVLYDLHLLHPQNTEK